MGDDPRHFADVQSVQESLKSTKRPVVVISLGDDLLNQEIALGTLRKPQALENANKVLLRKLDPHCVELGVLLLEALIDGI